MGKCFTLIAGCLLSITVLASQDWILKIGSDGSVKEVPAPWGPARVSVRYAKSGMVSAVQLSGRKFKVDLAPCIVARLGAVKEVQASGFWEQSASAMPPYITLAFVQGHSAAQRGFTTVTLSLEDGHVLMGAWSRSRKDTHVIFPAGSCSAWRGSALWPNNSSKPTPLRGAA
jgi:hypothetical protein